MVIKASCSECGRTIVAKNRADAKRAGYEHDKMNHPSYAALRYSVFDRNRNDWGGIPL